MKWVETYNNGCWQIQEGHFEVVRSCVCIHLFGANAATRSLYQETVEIQSL
jgi:hypothetical protein